MLAYICIEYISLLFGIFAYHTLRYTFRVSVCFLWLACNVQLSWKYCNKDCNWIGVPNSIPFKLRGNPLREFGVKFLPTEKKKRTARILVTTSTLFDTLNNCCCREFVCLTENCWSRLILAILDIGNGYYWQWKLKKYGWCMVIKYYSRVPDRTLFQNTWYQILFQTHWCQTLSQEADARYLAYHYYTALLRKALLAIVYCTEQ